LVKEQLPEKTRLICEIYAGSDILIEKLLRLRVRDVTLSGKNKGRIYLKKAKGGQPREHVMDKILADRVLEYARTKTLGPVGFLFTSMTGNPYSNWCTLNE
jgi:integrase